MSAVINSFRQVLSAPYHWWLDKSERAGLTTRLARARAALQRFREAPNAPRIAVVKQDVNEDLYCCPRGSSPREIVESTLLRSGPVCLFSDWNADFLIVTTADDPECSLWQERATHLKWDTLEFYRSYRDRVPGRDYGQSRLATDPETVDWSAYDIVVSVDVAVPERVTRKFPQTRWCYYVREVKAPAYAAALERPHAGQDFVLNHHFRMRPARARDHVIEFPYHLQSPGCFHRLFGGPRHDDREQRGVFVDHHTMLGLRNDARQELAAFGPVTSVAPENGELIPTSVQLARRTMEPEFRSRLLSSRYFLITPGARNVFGTSVVEAIAAGCLAIGSRRSVGCGELFTDNTAAETPAEAITRMRRFEDDPALLELELRWQRDLVEYLCHVRPMSDLLERAFVPRSGGAAKTVHDGLHTGTHP